MANSKYEYVRLYEESSDPVILRGSYFVVRIDGQNFHRFSKAYKFTKPNDKRCLDLMSAAAQVVMTKFYPNIVISYGQSDEFSFVFRKSTETFNRRSNKFVSLVPAQFCSAFVRLWPDFMTGVKLYDDPGFDARVIMYPQLETLKDYMRWRQVDCHINNLYNTTFHTLTGDYRRGVLDQNGQYELKDLEVYNKEGFVKLTPQEADEKLKTSVSSEKNEILFTEYGINYNNELPQFKKGTLITLDVGEVEKIKKRKPKSTVEGGNGLKFETREVDFMVQHVDFINESFWQENCHLIQLLE